MSVAPITSSASQESHLVPLDTLMLQVMSERAEQCEETVRIIANEIDAQNQQLDVYNETKEKFLGAQKGDEIVLTEEEYLALETALGEDKIGPDDDDVCEVTSRDPVNGTVTVEIRAKDDNFDENKSVINTALDNEISSLNSLSQMKMIDLQSAMDKYNNAYSSASNFASKYNSSLSNVVSNMR
ncbi:hypothetical protein [Aliivibrio fischeri]|uniref:hypothetical protein n=1 Tax=Aliivibrio fischeri TaxID=668 RepID=UPI0006CF281A|nr:hypothetical protein [Aliivibrio fischeri]USR97946.1 hypothetical protein AVFI_15890 [Aliivibrio fischeri ATCC 7744 = JCM 18803 = DSM 507]GGK20316.1 hypothetical protein GCM10007987_00300 [Aliivibrio fischeri]